MKRKRSRFEECDQAAFAARLAAQKATLVSALYVVLLNGNKQLSEVARCALVAVGERIP